MSFAEIDRAIDSKIRVMNIERKNQAILIYNLADLIGYSTARIHNKSNKMPTLEEVFPSLFNTEERRAEKEQLEANRFATQLKAYSISHNNKVRGG